MNSQAHGPTIGAWYPSDDPQRRGARTHRRFLRIRFLASCWAVRLLLRPRRRRKVVQMSTTASLSPRLGRFIVEVADTIRDLGVPVEITGPSDHAPSLLTISVNHEIPVRTGGNLEGQAVTGLRQLAEQLHELADEFDGPSPIVKGGAL